MGWTSAAIPEEYGGAGSSIYLAAEAIIVGGSDAQRRLTVEAGREGTVDSVPEEALYVFNVAQAASSA